MDACSFSFPASSCALLQGSCIALRVCINRSSYPISGLLLVCLHCSKPISLYINLPKLVCQSQDGALGKGLACKLACTAVYKPNREIPRDLEPAIPPSSSIPMNVREWHPMSFSYYWPYSASSDLPKDDIVAELGDV